MKKKEEEMDGATKDASGNIDPKPEKFLRNFRMKSTKNQLVPVLSEQ